MTITGNVTFVGDKSSGVSARGNQWVARDFEVEYEHGQYPKSIMFRCMDANIVDKLAVGLNVEVKFDINVNKFNGHDGKEHKFNEVRIWRDGLHCLTTAQPQQQAPQQTQAQAPQQTAQPAQPAPQPQQQAPAQKGSDLPF